jgi:hypothetical protein
MRAVARPRRFRAGPAARDSFPGDGQKRALEFAGAKTFGTGVIVLTYRPAAQPG